MDLFVIAHLVYHYVGKLVSCTLAVVRTARNFG